MITINPRWLDHAETLARRIFCNVATPIIRQDRRTVAYHEAGHAIVAAELLGVPARGATIVSTIPGAAGVTWYGDAPSGAMSVPFEVQPEPFFPDCKMTVFGIAAMIFAGRQAEYIAAGVDPRGLVQGASPDDLYGVAMLSLGFPRAWLSSAPRGGAQRLARLILLEHWPKAEAVAAELLEHGTLNGDAIARQLTRSGPRHRHGLPVVRRAEL